MQVRRSILLFGAILALTAVGVQAGCEVDTSSGLLGDDTGSATFVAFEYDLFVATDTTPSVITSTMIPAIEIVMAESLEKFAIVSCGACWR